MLSDIREQMKGKRGGGSLRWFENKKPDLEVRLDLILDMQAATNLA